MNLWGNNQKDKWKIAEAVLIFQRTTDPVNEAPLRNNLDSAVFVLDQYKTRKTVKTVHVQNTHPRFLLPLSLPSAIHQRSLHWTISLSLTPLPSLSLTPPHQKPPPPSLILSCCQIYSASRCQERYHLPFSHQPLKGATGKKPSAVLLRTRLAAEASSGSPLPPAEALIVRVYSAHRH